jgi:transposase-like protein
MERLESKAVAPGAAEGARSATGGAPGGAAVEVVAKAQRRRFSAEYKTRILREADACAGTGRIGALLRREGLYSSHLTEWRKLRAQGALHALAARKRGRKPVRDARERELAKLSRENARLRRKLAQAEAVIDVQKKLCEILEIPLSPSGRDESEA